MLLDSDGNEFEEQRQRREERINQIKVDQARFNAQMKTVEFSVEQFRHAVEKTQVELTKLK